MTLCWKAVNDDELRLVDKTVDFLQSEFCPPSADPMWSVDYFRWKLGACNPAGIGHMSVATIGDKVVGTVSLTKKRLLIDGKLVIGGEVGDSYSSAAVRRKSKSVDLSSIDPDPNSYVNRSVFGRLASDVRARAEADGVSIIYGTPNKNAYPGWIGRLKYFDLKGYVNRSYSRPTLRLLLQRWPRLRVVSPLLAAIEALSIVLLRILHGRCLRRFSFESRVPTSEEIDNLWERLKPVRGFSLYRDAIYWRHRYLEHPIANYSFLSIFEQHRLVGMVVTRLFTVEGGKRVVSIVEWMVERRVSFSCILSVTIGMYRKSKVDVFNMWADGSGVEAKAARRSLFVSGSRVPIILADSACGRSLEAQGQNFVFFLGSSDAV